LPVSDDLRVSYGADAIEELEEVALRGIEGEIADVQFCTGDFERLRISGWLRLGGAICAGAAASGGFGTWPEEAQELLPETEPHRWLCGASR
jgi:hypothetical protein